MVEIESHLQAVSSILHCLIVENQIVDIWCFAVDWRRGAGRADGSNTGRGPVAARGRGAGANEPMAFFSWLWGEEEEAETPRKGAAQQDDFGSVLPG